MDKPTPSNRLEPDALMALIAEYLESLGPFEEGAVRANKWRTTEQLLHELNPTGWNLARLDEELLRRELAYEERLAQGLPPNVRVRRAYYPDRTTVLPLWGATKWLKQPSPGMSRRREDPPHDLPEDLRTPNGAPTAFLSYSSHDGDLAKLIARDAARLGLAPWMFETHIDHDGDITASVQEAIRDAACFIGIVTRRSMASLWMLTELHAANQIGKPLIMVIDTEDDELVHLFRSVKQGEGPPGGFDHGVEYSEAVVAAMGRAYAVEGGPDRRIKYHQRVHDFLVSLPLYQASGAAVAYPDLHWDLLGPLRLASFNDRLSEFVAPSGEG